MAQQITQLSITGGPDKWKLFQAAGAESGESSHVFFVLEDGRKIEANLLSIEREDGSGKSFNLKAKVALDGRSSGDFAVFSCDKLHYRTDTRKGHIICQDLP
jgi:hypothetical protein